jgi:nitrate/nitrite-specific signal transduction histidine kinase
MLALLLIVVYVSTFVTVFATHYFLLSSIVEFIETEARSPTGVELMMIPVKALIVVVPIVFVLMTIAVVFVSHRIAGPLQRLKAYMHRVGNGEFELRLRFRSYDEIHDVADAFNDMVNNLKTRYHK